MSKAGDVLTINGLSYDFTGLPDGATIPAGTIPCEWIVGPVDRVDGSLQITLVLPYGNLPEPWQEFPEPLLDVPDGQVDLPTNTTITIEEVSTEGGILRTTTTKRWHQLDEVVSVFIPLEEEENVGA